MTIVSYYLLPIILLLYSVSSCLHGMVQLAGGATPYAGRLEFCNNGQWATVCSDNFGSVAALVVCKQLLGENASKLLNLIMYQQKCPHIMIYDTGHSGMLIFIFIGAIWSRSRRVFGQGTTNSILDDVTCTGSESSISQCTYTEVRDFSAAGCYHSDDVEMICYGIYYMFSKNFMYRQCTLLSNFRDGWLHKF